MSVNRDKKTLANNYLDVLNSIQGVLGLGLDMRHLDVLRKDAYQAMLDATGRTTAEYPNGRLLARDILEGRI